MTCQGLDWLETQALKTRERQRLCRASFIEYFIIELCGERIGQSCVNTLQVYPFNGEFKRFDLQLWRKKAHKAIVELHIIPHQGYWYCTISLGLNSSQRTIDMAWDSTQRTFDCRLHQNTEDLHSNDLQDLRLDMRSGLGSLRLGLKTSPKLLVPWHETCSKILETWTSVSNDLKELRLDLRLAPKCLRIDLDSSWINYRTCDFLWNTWNPTRPCFCMT